MVITTSPLFRQLIITQAKKMVETGVTEAIFVDENGKQYEGYTIFIDIKPAQSFFQFDFPEDFPSGSGKKIFVGSN